MIINEFLAEKTADYLLEIGAVKLSPEKPFTWASGIQAPIYCDNRLTLSYPKIRNFLAQSLADEILKSGQKPDVIAGVATGAIALGVLVAEKLDMPFVYVRPEKKKHGRQNQIEGEIKTNDRVVIIEDLISTGGSSLMAAQALNEQGAQIINMLAIMTYEFDIAQQNFDKQSIELKTLCSYNYIIKRALETSYINKNELQMLQMWKNEINIK